MLIHTPMREPRRDHYLNPLADDDTQAALDAALHDLAIRRGFDTDHDATTSLHLLTSLIAQAERLLPKAVADTRNQGCSWAEIADLLGVTRATAWQRYSTPPAPSRRH
jgi:hypothetical protein